MVLTRKLGSAISILKFWIKASPNGFDQTPECLADLIFSYRGVAPLQVRSELLEFASLVRERCPKALLEIGTCAGGTFFVLCQLADPHAMVISLDLPGGRFGGGYSGYRVPILHRMKKTGQRLHLLRADSHSASTVGRVASALRGTPLDLLLIDGDHTYDGVKQDFEMYSPFVKPCGIVAFHDIAKHPPEMEVQVDRFWNEIKTEYRHREIIEDHQQGWGGIGVLFF
jgi:predicted O-methyltransferase YrrM